MRRETVTFTNEIEKIMSEKQQVTLKALAAVFNLPATRLYTVAKQPKEGEVYDAHVYNWDAIEKFVRRRLGLEGNPSTLEEVIDKAIALDAEFKEADGRRVANRGVAKKDRIEVDGKLIDQRKYATFEKEAEGEAVQLFCIKKDPEVYKAVYQTLSHTVLVPVSDKEGTVKGDNVKVIGNYMLNLKGVGPATLQEEIDNRFSGGFEATAPVVEAEAVDAE